MSKPTNVYLHKKDNTLELLFTGSPEQCHKFIFKQFIFKQFIAGKEAGRMFASTCDLEAATRKYLKENSNVRNQ